MIKLLYKTANRIRTIYWFIFRPKTFGVKTIIINKNNILLLKNSYGKSMWTLPGGGLKSRETPEMAAKREVKEETGLDIKNLVSIGKIFSEKEYKKDTIYYYSCESTETNLILSSEVSEVLWFNLSELPENISPISKNIIKTFIIWMKSDVRN